MTSSLGDGVEYWTVMQGGCELLKKIVGVFRSWKVFGGGRTMVEAP